jgi:hypothetical protein
LLIWMYELSEPTCLINKKIVAIFLKIRYHTMTTVFFFS